MAQVCHARLPVANDLSQAHSTLSSDPNADLRVGIPGRAPISAIPVFSANRVITWPAGARSLRRRSVLSVPVRLQYTTAWVRQLVTATRRIGLPLDGSPADGGAFLA